MPLAALACVLAGCSQGGTSQAADDSDASCAAATCEIEAGGGSSAPSDGSSGSSSDGTANGGEGSAPSDSGASDGGGPGPAPWPPPLPSGALDYYVSPSGSDLADGSASHPWLTLAHAGSTITGGNEPITVHVAPGTYALSSASCISSASSGTASAPITFVSDQRGGAKIDGQGACTVIWTQKGDYTNVWGFDFTGMQYAPSDCHGDGGSIVFYAEGPNGHVDFGYNVVHDLPWGFASAVIMEPWGGGTYTGAPTSVHDNVLSNIGNTGLGASDASCGPVNNYAVYVASGPGTYVYDNLLVNVPTIGIHCWHAANRVYIFNNTIVNAGIGILAGTGDNGSTVGAYYDVANNIIVHSQSGIFAEANSPGTLSTSSPFENNLLFGNANDWAFNDQGTDTTLQAAGMPVTGTVSSDPLFVDPGSGNYRLSMGSPAIGAGISQGAPDHDLDGYPRPSGAGVDIGAYQSH